jgi:hypothetical protein
MRNMRKKFGLLLLIFIIICVIACRRDSVDKTYFNGEINLVKEIKDVTNLTAGKIELNGPFYGWPFVYDSLIIFWNNKIPDNFFNVYNLNTGEETGHFCSKGHGPKDASSLPAIYNVYKENNELKTLLFAHNESKLLLWNISRSVASSSTVIDTIIPFDWRKEHGIAHNLFMFHLDKDTLLASVKTSLLTKEAEEATLPCYEKRTVYTNELIRKYDIYLKPIRNGDASILPEAFLSTMDCITPDGTKIVQAMRRLAQINIIDVNSGKVTAYRLKGSPDFSIFKTNMRNSKVYYTRIQCDDNFIYALYLGEQFDITPSSKSLNPHIIHIFDWEGNMIQKLNFHHPVHEICVDIVRNKLYAMDLDAEELYCYNLNELKLKQ